MKPRKNRGFTILEIVMYFTLFLMLSFASFSFFTKSYFLSKSSLSKISISREMEGTNNYIKKAIDFDNILSEPEITKSSISFETLGYEGDKSFIKKNKIYYDSNNYKIKFKRENLSTPGINIIDENISDFEIEDFQDKITIKYTKTIKNKSYKQEIEIYK